jgi:flagellar biosynthesis/type III secretory pathway M-ring protein FliF/YscJ
VAVQGWILVAVVVIVVAVIVSLRAKQGQERQTQARRMRVQAQGRAHSADGAIRQREARRLSGMTAEDRAWEQASLQRNQEIHGPARHGTGAADHR